MADITVRNQGQVDDSGKVNWRGDQSIAPQGGQSIYKTSSIQLAQMGSRKVVGDRVFRYAKANQTVQKGIACAQIGSGTTAGNTVLFATSNEGLPGSRIVDLHNPASAIAKNEYAEGYLLHETGAGDRTDGGWLYRIKSHAGFAVSNSAAFTLYDPIVGSIAIADSVTILKNIYMDVGSCTAVQIPVGIAPIDVTADDYFWLQTWGPSVVNVASANTLGSVVFIGTSGQCIGSSGGAAGVNDTVGVLMLAAPSTSRSAVAFIRIAG